ncbi:signal transduction histidine kinase/ActR/RegA family two-component response regulator [Pedobacter africanus]|uniref:Signal transduction histidine kinase/ActR/RegA family two-component response regulator n=1 Tax=Pedobacter africanus TaxID=151894 RepID=A0ACC6L123_9SPHI|nr:ATP-binding protein [Pedobacter africanus]MDR6785120.1 signal transduction histidine kinase/ActR/RegA family two-component response regulator [Pedobacter africanus]
MKIKQRSFLIIFAVIVIFIGFLFRNSILQRAEQKQILTTLSELEINNRQISKLDTITLSLQTAENNFRMYTALWNQEYFVKYTTEIKRISALLSELAVKDQGNISGIVGDLKSKRRQMLLYGEIKKLADSITNINLQLSTANISKSLLPVKTFPKPVVKKTVEVEEIKSEPVVQKKKFFQRLKNAILNKQEPKDTATIRKTETTYEPVETGIEAYNKKQVERISAYYKGLLDDQKRNHARLTDKEQTILVLNERIFEHIKQLFKEYKDNSTIVDDARKLALKNKAKNSLNTIDRSGKLNFLISVLAYLGIIFMLYKLYRAYDKTIKANQLAAEQVASKSRFFTSISHEMRTPLNAIMGVSEQLKSTPLNEDQRAMSKLLDNSSSMLLSAVNEVLDFSRLETRKLSLAKTPFRYKRILNEVAGTTKVLADQKKLSLELLQEGEPDLLLDGDPYRLKQIVTNLTANAIKFTDKGKVSIEVEVKPTDEKHVLLLIKVKDTGIGISAENIPLIFNEFSQVIHSKRNDWQTGSGLGLTISKKLVDLHKGKINVQSTPGKGTTFIVELPYRIAPEEEENLDLQQEQVINSDRFKNIHVLVVDDSEMNLLVIKMIFKKLGISYDTAEGGQDALQQIEKKKYDLVLTDIQMPEMDGMELTRRIRANTDLKKSKIPVIAITGQISPDFHEMYLAAGLNDYLIKPISEMELKEKILDYIV